MALDMGPRLDETPPTSPSKRKSRRIDDILALAAVIALGAFLAVLITAIVTASGH
jgi:hypothetical protein